MPGAAPPQQLLDQLRGALAPVAFREEDGVLIASPASTAEVAALLRHCDRSQIAVEIAGARTKRTWAGAARAPLVLETARLAGVREHPWQDLTATVGAGTPWAEMQRGLAAHGQLVALDPLWPERATVGGVLAANDSGALRLKYGSARDLVIGMTIVLADGTIAKTGGKVVKNVAGYDLHKLMIGAFGTLAVITEVTFRLHPLPQHRAAFTLPSASLEPLMKMTSALAASTLQPEAIQLRTAQGVFALDVLLAAAPGILHARSEALAALARAHALHPSPVDEAVILRAREPLFDASSSTPVLKASLLPTAVCSALGQLASAGAEAVAYPFGIVYAAAAASALPAPSEGFLSRVDESAPPSGLMREIKRQFDPHGTLNRGRMGGV